MDKKTPEMKKLEPTPLARGENTTPVPAPRKEAREAVAAALAQTLAKH